MLCDLEMLNVFQLKISSNDESFSASGLFIDILDCDLRCNLFNRQTGYQIESEENQSKMQKHCDPKTFHGHRRFNSQAVNKLLTLLRPDEISANLLSLYEIRKCLNAITSRHSHIRRFKTGIDDAKEEVPSSVNVRKRKRSATQN